METFTEGMEEEMKLQKKRSLRVLHVHLIFISHDRKFAESLINETQTLDQDNILTLYDFIRQKTITNGGSTTILQ